MMGTKTRQAQKAAGGLETTQTQRLWASGGKVVSGAGRAAKGDAQGGMWGNEEERAWAEGGKVEDAIRGREPAELGIVQKMLNGQKGQQRQRQEGVSSGRGGEMVEANGDQGILARMEALRHGRDKDDAAKQPPAHKVIAPKPRHDEIPDHSGRGEWKPWKNSNAIPSCKYASDPRERYVSAAVGGAKTITGLTPVARGARVGGMKGSGIQSSKGGG